MKKNIDDSINFGKDILSIMDLITEESFDTYDNVFEVVQIGFEEEFRKFLTELLIKNSDQFVWSFTTPRSELFGKGWKNLQDKYQNLDDTQRKELAMRIGIYFRKFFVSKFPWINEKAANILASKYKEILVTRLVDKQIGPELGGSNG